MTAPLAYDRVLAAVRRFFPFEVTITRSGGALPAVGDSRVGRELGTIAWVIARAADRVNAMLDELFPDTAEESIARWEKVTRVASVESDALADRQARVLARFRRLSGPRLDQIATALSSVLQLAPEDIQFFETQRIDIDAMTTSELNLPSALAIPSGSDMVIPIGVPWPGFVDDTGVQVEIRTSGLGVPVYKLEHSSGTSWTIATTAAAQTTENRTAFLGKAAGTGWQLRLRNTAGGINLLAASLRVSNTIDSAQIYNFYAYRDLALPGTSDTRDAQRIFNRTALGHMNAFVIERDTFVFDDEHSLIDREPFGP